MLPHYRSCLLYKNMKRKLTYIRHDGWSESSLPQTLPVKTFKPPEHKEIRFYTQHLNVFLLTLLRVTSLTCVSGCPSLHFSGSPASQMDCLCGHKHLQLKMSPIGFCMYVFKSPEICFLASCFLSFRFVLIPEDSIFGRVGGTRGGL